MVNREKYIEPMAKSWVEDATKLIKFKDDRLRVQAELLDHIEDAADAWKDAGYDDYEAKKKAVSNMGDAAEVANNLADIYRPFWGRLWKLTKWLRNLAIVNLIIFLFVNMNYIGISTDLTSLNSGFERVLYDSRPEQKIRLNGYTVKLERVRTTKYKEENNDKIVVDILLEVSTQNPYLRNPDIYNGFTAYDDVGNVYPLESHYAWRNKTGMQNEYYIYSSRRSTGQRQVFEQLSMSVHPDTTEITLVFDRFGETFQFTTPVIGGVDNG